MADRKILVWCDGDWTYDDEQLLWKSDDYITVRVHSDLPHDWVDAYATAIAQGHTLHQALDVLRERLRQSPDARLCIVHRNYTIALWLDLAHQNYWIASGILQMPTLNLIRQHTKRGPLSVEMLSDLHGWCVVPYTTHRDVY